MDYAIASDLSYRVLQARRRRGELSLPQQDFSRERPYLVPQRPVIRFWDMGEGQIGLDETDREIVPVSISYRTRK